jgi:hypothetical protein
MVLSAPCAQLSAGSVSPNSILKVGELESCENTKCECTSLLESLNTLWEVHKAAGLPVFGGVVQPDSASLGCSVLLTHTHHELMSLY